MSNKRQLLLTCFEKDSKRSRKESTKDESIQEVVWKTICRDDLLVRYSVIFPSNLCSKYLRNLEKEINYLSGDMSKVKVFGKWHDIPRKHTAYGEAGIKYTYSGVTVLAKPWTETLLLIKNRVEELTCVSYNFVLVNRYADGNDRMGFHKDDEKELDMSVPIASVSLGAARDFIFKHQDPQAGIPNEKILLENGMLLLMEGKTNECWYHGLPARKRCSSLRINLTFRKIVVD